MEGGNRHIAIKDHKIFTNSLRGNLPMSHLPNFLNPLQWKYSDDETAIPWFYGSSNHNLAVAISLIKLMTKFMTVIIH